MKNYLIGIDAGNTASKVVVFDEYGNIMSSASTPSMRFEKRGRGFEEFDMNNLWQDIKVCIGEAIKKSGVEAKDIKGIGAGIYSGYDDAFTKAVKVLDPILPDKSKAEIYEKKYADWTLAIESLMNYWENK